MTKEPGVQSLRSRPRFPEEEKIKLRIQRVNDMYYDGEISRNDKDLQGQKKVESPEKF